MSLAAVAVAGCASEATPAAATQAITHGSDDGDAAIVGLLSGEAVVCSGVVVAPRVVLTAAHCLTPAPDAIFVGATLATAGARIAVQQAVAHPDYDDQTLEHDLGVLTLGADAAVAPAALFAGSVDNRFVGREVVVAGFGRTATGDAAPSARHAGLATVRSVAADELELAPGPSQPCLGDSGGPTLLRDDDGEFIVGIHSSGDLFCSGFARDTRIDAHREFIDPLVFGEAYRAGSDVVGGCGVGGGAGGGSFWPVVAVAALCARGRRRRRRAGAQPGTRLF